MTAGLGSAAAARPGRIGGRGRLLRGYYLLLLILLYVPLAVLLLFSITGGRTLSFPPEGFTLEWYARVFESDALLRSARNSLIVGVVSSVAATTLGTMVAILTVRFRFRAKPVLVGLAVMPLIVPFVVLAVALLLLFRAAGLNLSLWTIAVGHTVVALPFTLLIVISRLSGFERDLEEAAMDLGASHLGALRYVVLPIIAPAIVSAWLTAFTVSFDEFALSLFLAGTEPTFPVYLFSQLRFANQLPVLIALAVLMMAGTIALVLVAERVRRVGLSERTPG
jgi:spermidine/putrescine transport system permease protein